MTAFAIDVDRYERDGFEVVGRVCPPDTLHELRGECLRTLRGARAALPPGTPYDLAVLDDDPGPATRALVERLRPAAERLLLGPVDPTFVLMHATTTTPERGRGWHQALAYHRLPYSPCGSSVPLDEVEVLVTLEPVQDPARALLFVPGYHVLPMLEHRRVAEPTTQFELVDPSRQLVLDDAVAVPLDAGEAVAYTVGTPHSCIYAPAGAEHHEVLFLRVGFRDRSVGDPEEHPVRLA